jgi:hypothetical protein
VWLQQSDKGGGRGNRAWGWVLDEGTVDWVMVRRNTGPQTHMEMEPPHEPSPCLCPQPPLAPAPEISQLKKKPTVCQGPF